MSISLVGIEISPEAIAAASAGVAAATSIALVYFTYRLARLTKDLAVETRLTREARDHAEIEVAVEPHPMIVNMFELVVSNAGQGAAWDVRLQIGGTGLRRRSTDASESEPARELRLASFLPGAKHRMFLNSALSAARDAFVEVDYEFCDTRGKHSKKLRQEFSGWFGYGRIGEDPGYSAAKSLEHIAKTLDGWNGFRKLQVDIFNEADRMRLYEEQEEWLREQTADAESSGDAIASKTKDESNEAP
jgi:hypothetical protein